MIDEKMQEILALLLESTRKAIEENPGKDIAIRGTIEFAKLQSERPTMKNLNVEVL